MIYTHRKEISGLMSPANFDIDLKFGKIYEEKVRNIFEGEGKIEVKTERDIWATTGNMAIEIRYDGRMSGISTTEATWWAHVFTIDGDMKFFLTFKVEKLKKYIKKLLSMKLARIVDGGDDHKSEIVLIPVKYIVGKSWI